MDSKVLSYRETALELYNDAERRILRGVPEADDYEVMNSAERIIHALQKRLDTAEPSQIV